MKTSCLWVAYAAHAHTGLVIAADGFFPGSLPLTPEVVLQIKETIAKLAQAQMDKLRPVDQKGQQVLGAPKPKVAIIEIKSIQPAEFEAPVEAPKPLLIDN